MQERCHSCRGEAMLFADDESSRDWLLDSPAYEEFRYAVQGWIMKHKMSQINTIALRCNFHLLTVIVAGSNKTACSVSSGRILSELRAAPCEMYKMVQGVR